MVSVDHHTLFGCMYVYVRVSNVSVCKQLPREPVAAGGETEVPVPCAVTCATYAYAYAWMHWAL